MKNRILLLLLITITSGFSITVLYKFAERSQKVSTTFKRTFMPSLQVTQYIDLKEQFATIAGFGEGNVYVSQPNLYRIITYDTLLKFLESRTIDFDAGFIPHGIPEVVIEGRNIYLIDYRDNKLYYGDLSTLNVKIITLRSTTLAEAVPLDSGNIIVRELSQDVREFTLAKLSLPDKHIENTNLLQKQVDGIFCTDGKLLYDANTHSLIYIYFYRNEFFQFDENLNLKYRAHTIDTFSHVKLQPVTNKRKGTTTLSAPSIVINRKSCVDGDYIYINSSVMGAQEDDDEFYKNDVIDVYELNDGKYLESFYVPHFRGQGLKDFRVKGKYLYALYGNYLTVSGL